MILEPLYPWQGISRYFDLNDDAHMFTNIITTGKYKKTCFKTYSRIIELTIGGFKVLHNCFVPAMQDASFIHATCRDFKKQSKEELFFKLILKNCKNLITAEKTYSSNIKEYEGHEYRKINKVIKNKISEVLLRSNFEKDARRTVSKL